MCSECPPSKTGPMKLEPQALAALSNCQCFLTRLAPAAQDLVAFSLGQSKTLAFAIFAVLSCIGCSMTAPIYVWQPPLNQPRTIQSIALAPIHGPPELAVKLDKAMIESQPKTGNAIALLHPKLLEEMTSIQMASFDGHPSDIAGLSAARRANADVLIQGQIVRARLEPQEPKRGRLDFRKRPSEQVIVSWTVTDVPSGERLKSETLTLDREQSELIFPDVKAMSGDPVDRVIQAISRQSWKTFSPMTNKEDALLALPWISPGASRMRQGNGYARQGRWDLAEQKWQDVASKHPSNNAAWNNLALAAAAHEDFELARDRIEHSKTIVPWDRARTTERWIDKHQHNYHRALGLPDREGGWLMPDPPLPKPIEEIPSADVQDIDELPWWTAIPGTKPPGWSWGQWLTQPRAM